MTEESQLRATTDSPQASQDTAQPVTLARMRCTSSDIPFVKAGKKVLYDKADLNVYLDARRCGSTSDAARRTA